eukprot:m.307283 g.307283  ORF g.307283 m.307283 type:complete len:1084 (-) comp23022_c5_seq5:1469-4720(-)
MESLKKSDLLMFSGEEDQFPSWARKMQSTLAILDLSDTLSRTGNASDEKKAKAYRLIVMSLADSVSHLAGEVQVNDPFALWTLLRDTFASGNRERVAGLRARLLGISLQQHPTELAAIDAAAKLLDMLRACVSTDHPDTAAAELKLLEEQAASTIVRQLPRDFAPVKLQLTQSDAAPTLRQLRTTIVNFRRVMDDEEPTAAAAAQPSALAAAAQPSGNRHRRARKPQSDLVCSFCSRKGHNLNTCREAKKVLDANRPSSASVQVATVGPDEPLDEYVMLMAGAASKVLPSRPAGPSVRICVDTGATHHVFCRREYFRELRPCSKVVRFGNSTSTPVAGIGTVPLAFTTASGKVFNVVLTDVLFMPEAPFSLFSVKHFRAAVPGSGLVIDGEGSFLTASGHEVPVKQSGPDLLYFVTARATAVDASATVLHTTAEQRALDVHRAYGHLNARDLCRLGLLNSAADLPPCPVCVSGKSSRKPTAKAAAPRATEIGQHLHCDLNGPLEVPSFKGARYALIVVDDATNYYFVRVMRQKSDVVESFRLCLDELASLGHQPRPGAVLQSDCDAVFEHGAFAALCRERGIRQQFSAPHTQSQNGKAERAWRTLFEMLRCMLIDAQLPKEYWAAALVHASRVRNLCPSAPHGGQSPFRLMHGRDPDTTFLHPFGSRCLVHVEDGQRKKLDPKARESLYVGFDIRSKAALLFVPSTKALVRSMHFDVFPLEGVKSTTGVQSSGKTSAPLSDPTEKVIMIDLQLPATATPAEATDSSDDGEGDADDADGTGGPGGAAAAAGDDAAASVDGAGAGGASADDAAADADGAAADVKLGVLCRTLLKFRCRTRAWCPPRPLPRTAPATLVRNAAPSCARLAMPMFSRSARCRQTRPPSSRPCPHQRLKSGFVPCPQSWTPCKQTAPGSWFRVTRCLRERRRCTPSGSTAPSICPTAKLSGVRVWLCWEITSARVLTLMLTLFSLRSASAPPSACSSLSRRPKAPRCTAWTCAQRSSMQNWTRKSTCNPRSCWAPHPSKFAVSARPCTACARARARGRPSWTSFWSVKGSLAARPTRACTVARMEKSSCASWCTLMICS